MKYLFAMIAIMFESHLPLSFVCWYSKEYHDIHDYKENLGGDGIPTHDYTYTCKNCGHTFTI